MNKKAESSVLMSNAVYIIILILFLAGMLLFVHQQKNGAGFYESYYAQKIAQVVDMAQPGMNVSLNIQQASEVAKGAGFTDYSEMFEFNNEKNEICVKLNSGSRESCYYYFTDFDVRDVKLHLGTGKNGGNYLTFYIAEKQEVGNGK